MDIRCKKTDCTFNTGCSCSAKEIKVTRGTLCAKYDPDKVKQDLEKKLGNIFETSEDLAPQNLHQVNLACDAKCLYNKCNKCYANGITVIDTEKQAECATFIPK